MLILSIQLNPGLVSVDESPLRGSCFPFYLPGNLSLDARHCDLTLLDVLFFLIPINLLVLGPS